MTESRRPKGTRALTLRDEAETVRFGEHLARALQPGDVVALTGDLGAGKTALARAVIRFFLPEGEVPSPTFTIVQTYRAPDFEIWHTDFYRLKSANEVLELGLDDALETGVLLIEWPERAAAWLPHDRLDVRFAFAPGDMARRVELVGYGRWAGRVEALAAGFAQ